MFDLNEVNKRTKEASELLEGVKKKMRELKKEFNELTTECEKYDDYFTENPDAKKALSDRIRERLSMLELLKEVAEDTRDKTWNDMRLVLKELQKTKYYD